MGDDDSSAVKKVTAVFSIIVMSFVVVGLGADVVAHHGAVKIAIWHIVLVGDGHCLSSYKSILIDAPLGNYIGLHLASYSPPPHWPRCIHARRYASSTLPCHTYCLRQRFQDETIRPKRRTAILLSQQHESSERWT
jgi:hypothetical protein